MEAMRGGLKGLQGQLKEGRKEKREGRKCSHTHTKNNCGYGHRELSGLGVDEE